MTRKSQPPLCKLCLKQPPPRQLHRSGSVSLCLQLSESFLLCFPGCHGCFDGEKHSKMMHILKSAVKVWKGLQRINTFKVCYALVCHRVVVFVAVNCAILKCLSLRVTTMKCECLQYWNLWGSKNACETYCCNLAHTSSCLGSLQNDFLTTKIDLCFDTLALHSFHVPVVVQSMPPRQSRQ